MANVCGVHNRSRRNKDIDHFTDLQGRRSPLEQTLSFIVDPNVSVCADLLNWT